LLKGKNEKIKRRCFMLTPKLFDLLILEEEWGNENEFKISII